MDMRSTALESASNIAGLERAARRRAEAAAETARRKGQDAQERFVAGVRAQGMSLDEVIEVEVRGSTAEPGVWPAGSNKYTALMDRRKQMQRQEKATM
jgi:hypothetical protein